MKKTLFAFTLALAAPAAFANDDVRASSASETQASEFTVGLDPSVNYDNSRTGRLVAFDVDPKINVMQTNAPLFAVDLSPSINMSSRTQRLFDINPHINVR